MRAISAFLLWTALAFAPAAAAPCADAGDPGAIAIGASRLSFSVLRAGEAVKTPKEVPGLGAAILSLRWACLDGAAPAADVELLREKNQFDPPELLKSYALPPEGLSFEHVFPIEGKFIVAVRAHGEDGVVETGRYVFFVIDNAESHPLIVGLFSLACLTAVALIWRGRGQRPIPPAPQP